MTSNGELNFILAQRADEEFQPPRVLAVFPRDPEVSAPANKPKVQQAFLPDLSVKTWNEYLSDRRVKLGTTTDAERAGVFFSTSPFTSIDQVWRVSAAIDCKG